MAAGETSFLLNLTTAQERQPLQLLPALTLGGAWQMAIDGWMHERRQRLLRLYRWSRPTLSIGHHQKQLEPHWLDLAGRGVIDLVRRPTGGRAVLHGGDLCYALIWPDAIGTRTQVYRQACEWLRQAFETLGLPLQFGEQTASAQRSSCFAVSTAADLVHAQGEKRIGSAQLWRRGCLLQHGSIQISPPADLWQLVFGTPSPRLSELPVGGQELEAILMDSARKWLPTAAGGLVPLALPSDQLAGITRRAGELQDGRASPEATMALTTGARARPNG